MAPELTTDSRRTSALDSARVDTYSFGVVASVLVTGCKPYAGDSFTNMFTVRATALVLVRSLISMLFGLFCWVAC